MLIGILIGSPLTPKEAHMGFLDKMFGSKKDYPTLDQNDPTTNHLNAFRQTLEELISEVSDPLEVVPAKDSAFIFIGKPPKKFGVAWIEEDGKIINFKTLVNEKGLSMISLEKLSDKLKDVYVRHQEEPRFSTTIKDRQVVVTPSSSLLSDVKEVIKETVS